MKEKLCRKYFENKIKPKHLKEFNDKTPEGNEISGFINLKANKHLGSLVITHIKEKNGDEYDTEQFVQAFPKIHYWDERHRLKENDESIVYYCQEKLDGSCLIIYALLNKNGQCIEIVPKTRSMAVADEHILEMYNLIDKKAIEEFFQKKTHFNDSLMFELYGILNRHEISHMDTYIDIRLIGAYIDGEFLDYIGMTTYYDLDAFCVPETFYLISKYPQSSEYSIRWDGFESKLKCYEKSTEDKFPTLYDAIQEIKLLLKEINDEYIKHNGRRAVEGVVINGQHFNGEQMYLKIKPEDIIREAMLIHGIPRKFIVKGAQKYFDEYGSKIREIYERDDAHYLKYIKRQLAEEFSYEEIEDPKTTKRIKKVFMDVWDSKVPPISLQNICDDLVNKNPDASITELMKLFAKNNPSKKDKSRFVYNILSKKVK